MRSVDYLSAANASGQRPNGISAGMREVRSWASRCLASQSFRLPRWPVPNVTAPVTAVCVYRKRNSDYVNRLIVQLPSRSEVRLHALDAPSPNLAKWTISEGPGARMPLLRGLVEARPVNPEAYLLLFDDDATFVAGGLTQFFDFAAAACLDIFGPAIQTGQAVSHNTMKTHPLRTARRVGFVETGPIVGFSARALSQVTLFPEGSQMGWGDDIRWAVQARAAGLNLGIVDATPIWHHRPLGSAYDPHDEQRQVARAFEETGTSWSDLIIPNAPSWRPWQRRASWVSPPS